MAVKLTAPLVEAFAGAFLSPMYDDPQPTPQCHRDWWELYCSDEQFVGLAAPRGHAKSTALTHDFGLASVCFRVESHVLIVSATEELAMAHLSDMATELRDNDELRKSFGISKFLIDSKGEIIIKCVPDGDFPAGYQFRIIARGAGQKLRGLKWRGRRPGLIICHKKGTQITADGQTMLVEEHPTARSVVSHGVLVDVHGLCHTETVTLEHRYWVKRIHQKKAAEYKNGVKVRRYTEYITKEPTWVEAKDLDKECWIGLPIDMREQEPPELSGYFLDDFWWLLGLWWGDGSIGNQSQVCWYVADKDVDTVGARILAFFARFDKHVGVTQKTGCLCYTVCDKALFNVLLPWKHGNSCKTAPEWVLILPLSYQRLIIQGYVAADGWVDLEHQQVRLTSVWYPGLLQVKQILARLGIVGTIRQGLVGGQRWIQDRKVTCQTKYDLMFRDGAFSLGYPIADSERYALKQVFIEDGFQWSHVKNTFPSGLQEFIPITTQSHTYTTAYGLSHNCDDMEEDEQVENYDRRRKFRKWVMRALLPLGRREAKIRWHGTILHEDSMLQRLMNDPTCKSALYRAHRDFDDFRDILWPEMWNEARLRQMRQRYIEQGDSPGYSQELLNDPFAQDYAYLRKVDFLPMSDLDRKSEKRVCVGVDFAVSTNSQANRTSFTIGGQDALNFIHIIDQRADRWDPLEWIDEMFLIQRDHDPEAFFVEDGVIWKSVQGTIYREMTARGVWMNLVPLSSTKDKAARGRPLQKRHRAGSMKFDKEADWYDIYEAELLRFTGTGDAREDDRFDSTSILVRGIESLSELDKEDFYEDEELDLLYGGPEKSVGRSTVTGY